MRRMGLLGTLALAAELALRAQTGVGYRVAGTVVNALTGEPVAGAEVTLTPDLPESTDGLDARSDASGRFAFNRISQGHYRLVAWRRGYLRRALDEHNGFSTSVVTGPKLDTSQIVFPMQPAASIRGRVLDEDGEPVQQAQVSLFEKRVQDGAQGLRAVNFWNGQNSGRFHFSGLEPGTYYMAVSARPWYAQTPNRMPVRVQAAPEQAAVEPAPELSPSPFDVAYPLTWFAGAVDLASATPIRLAAGQTFSADITLHPVPAVHIRLDAPQATALVDGRTVQRPRTASVVLEGPEGMDLVANANQNASNGHLYLDGLAPGRYRIDYYDYDPTTGKPLGQGSLTLDASANLTLAADSQPALSIDGLVTLDQPLKDGGRMELGFRPWPGHAGGGISVSVAADGRLSVSPVSLRRNQAYEVYLPGHPELTITAIEAEGAKAAGRILTLAGTEIHLKVNVAHGVVATVDGFALKDNEGAPGVAVLLIPEDPALRPDGTFRDQSNTDGSFHLANVAPGSYLAIAVEGGFGLAYANAEAMAPYLAQAQKVRVGTGVKQLVNINVQPLR